MICSAHCTVVAQDSSFDFVSGTIALVALIVSTIAILYSVVTLKGQNGRVAAIQNAIDILSEDDAESEEVAILEKQKSDAIEELKAHAGTSDSDRIISCLLMLFGVLVWATTLPATSQLSFVGSTALAFLSFIVFISPALLYFAKLRRSRLKIVKEISPDCEHLTLGQFAEKRRWSAELNELREKWRNQTKDKSAIQG